MEDASGVDLDWFWRGWFYTTDHVDISIDDVTEGTLDTGNPAVENELKRREKEEEPLSLTIQRNQDLPKRIEENPALRDFYNDYDEFSYGQGDIEAYRQQSEGLEDWQREARDSSDYYYYLTFSNLGGLVMPIIYEVTYEGGQTETVRLPAEIWRRNPKEVTRLQITSRRIISVEIDPYWETADVDRSDNVFPRQIEKRRLNLSGRSSRSSLMKRLDFKVEPGSLRAITVSYTHLTLPTKA